MGINIDIFNTTTTIPSPNIGERTVEIGMPYFLASLDTISDNVLVKDDSPFSMHATTYHFRLRTAAK